MNEIFEVVLDAFLDTLKVFAVVLVVYFILSFFEAKLANKLEKNKKLSPLIGASVGLIPQCGFSVISADLYKKKYISLGTLIAVFVACSDEALPIMLSNIESIKMVLPLLATKFVIALASGYLIDLILLHRQIIIEKHNHENEFMHKGCCHHEIEHEDGSFVKQHIVHPLLHSLKISAYVLAINLLFGFIIYFIGENTIKDFLNNSI